MQEQEAVEPYRITTTAMVPTVQHRLVELGEETIRSCDTSSLEVIFARCAPFTCDVMRYFRDTLQRLLFRNHFDEQESELHPRWKPWTWLL